MSDTNFEAREISLDVLSECGRCVKLLPVVKSVALQMGIVFGRMHPWADYGVSPMSLFRYFLAREPGAPRFAVYVGEDVAGVVGIRMNWLRGPYLQFLGIVPAHQNTGIGRLVLEWFEEQARAENAANLWVMVSRINARALTFYEQHGYREAAELKDIVTAGRTEVLMRKQLG